ncbi:MAG: tRNA uridine-5-carboxymethylaminomethyl(34) synthesis enzyme MnmG, partial [Clostridia bacterium]|nr:tRNA uridine-5-carboxymethylaminomethyl(34) synthesis enzyme MnmG [Clostridia bacterium]
DRRLCAIGHACGLLPEERYLAVRAKEEEIARECARLKTLRIPASKELCALLEEKGSSAPAGSMTMAELLRRPQVDYADLMRFDPQPISDREIRLETEIEIKYEGYIAKQLSAAKKLAALENKKLPEGIDYFSIGGLRLEARQKLHDIRPANIGQASRISGVSPADISVLLIYLSKNGTPREVREDS